MLPSADDPALSKITYAELVELFSEQARALAEGGVDLFIVETMVDILEQKAAITGINRLCRERAGRRRRSSTSAGGCCSAPTSRR
jgi:5-methyltetrahydrofolate--homocysteine methyltransferase